MVRLNIKMDGWIGKKKIDGMVRWTGKNRMMVGWMDNKMRSMDKKNEIDGWMDRNKIDG